MKRSNFFLDQWFLDELDGLSADVKHDKAVLVRLFCGMGVMALKGKTTEHLKLLGWMRKAFKKDTPQLERVKLIAKIDIRLNDLFA